MQTSLRGAMLVAHPAANPDMPSAQPSAAKRDTLNLRIRPEDRSLIDRAARLLGKSRTDFMLGAARVAAEEAVLDQAVIRVGHKAYTAFLARLDAAPEPNENLRRTMRSQPPWTRD